MSADPLCCRACRMIIFLAGAFYQGVIFVRKHVNVIHMSVIKFCLERGGVSPSFGYISDQFGVEKIYTILECFFPIVCSLQD